MSDSENQELPENEDILNDERELVMQQDMSNSVEVAQRVYQLLGNWADFHLFITSPNIPARTPAVIIPPKAIPGTDEMEFVYPIHDSGYKLSTSKAEDMFSAGMSMCKLFFTIEKMVDILIERLQSEGVDKETEVQIAFGGYQLAQRKAFESVINLSYNVVVTNFDPGAWGEFYLETIKRMADKYGYPKEAPRDNYKKPYTTSGAKIKR